MKANNLDRERLIKDLTTFTPADIAIMEEQAEALYQDKKTTRKYRRSLQLALADAERKPVVSVQPQQRFDPITEEWIKRTTVSERFWTMAIGGPIAAAGFIGLVCGALWILQRVVQAVAK